VTNPGLTVRIKTTAKVVIGTMNIMTHNTFDKEEHMEIEVLHPPTTREEPT